jgi:hypothetical protein
VLLNTQIKQLKMQNMTWQNDLQHILFSKLMVKRVLQGAGIGLVLISIFILGTLTGNGKIGTIVFIPMAAVAIGGACGGAFYCFMDLFRNQGGWKKHLANVISVLVYFIGCYMSLILALNAMGLWD